jgi:hypothetical protein
MLALFAAALLTVVGAGWYLGWYKVHSQPASVAGQHSVNIDINTDKVVKDLQNGEKKIQNMLESKTKEEAKKLPDLKKTGDNLMLPSPDLKFQTGGGSSLEFNATDKGPTFQIDGGNKAPLLQFGNTDKGTFIHIGTTEKKK